MLVPLTLFGNHIAQAQSQPISFPSQPVSHLNPYPAFCSSQPISCRVGMPIPTRILPSAQTNPYPISVALSSASVSGNRLETGWTGPSLAMAWILRRAKNLVFKAHRLCVSLNSRLESNEEEEEKMARVWHNGESSQTDSDIRNR